MCFERAVSRAISTPGIHLPIATKLSISSTTNIFCIVDQVLTPGNKNTSQNEQSNWKKHQNMLEKAIVVVSEYLLMDKYINDWVGLFERWIALSNG